MIRKVLGTAATTALVVAAAALAAWFIFAGITGATLVTFKTGSMAPTMPQGAIAISMPVEAADISVDDVVTVPRPRDQQPVTHRVVEVRSPQEASNEGIPADARELVLKGDDNDTVDIRPYVVKDAKRVVFAMPYLGTALSIAKSPVGIGLLIMIFGGLTTWAFWPAAKPTDDPDDDAAEEDADEIGLDLVTSPSTPTAAATHHNL